MARRILKISRVAYGDVLARDVCQEIMDGMAARSDEWADLVQPVSGPVPPQPARDVAPRQQSAPQQQQEPTEPRLHPTESHHD